MGAQSYRSLHVITLIARKWRYVNRQVLLCKEFPHQLYDLILSYSASQCSVLFDLNGMVLRFVCYIKYDSNWVRLKPIATNDIYGSRDSYNFTLKGKQSNSLNWILRLCISLLLYRPGLRTSQVWPVFWASYLQAWPNSDWKCVNGKCVRAPVNHSDERASHPLECICNSNFAFRRIGLRSFQFHAFPNYVSKLLRILELFGSTGIIRTKLLALFTTKCWVSFYPHLSK